MVWYHLICSPTQAGVLDVLKWSQQRWPPSFGQSCGGCGDCWHEKWNFQQRFFSIRYTQYFWCDNSSTYIQGLLKWIGCILKWPRYYIFWMEKSPIGERNVCLSKICHSNILPVTYVLSYK